MEKTDLLRLVQSILGEQGRGKRLAEIANHILNSNADTQASKGLDQRWIQAVKVGSTMPLMDSLLNNRLSQMLKELVDFSRGRLAEIFVFNPQGYILGLNQLTSDYWQGDESKWRALFEQHEGIHFSPIEFDHSTRKFVIQVTVPIVNEDTGARIAGITFGFDADLSLSAQKL